MNTTLLLLIGGAVVLILIGVGIYFTVTNQKSEEEERLGDYVAPVPLTQQDDSKTASAPVTDWITKRVEKSSWGDRIAKDLARADLKFKPGEYVALMVICAFLVGIIGYFLGKSSLILAAAGVIFGLFLPSIFVKQAQKRRLIKFSDQLADMLSLMVNGLRAGYSTLQAMEAVSKELPSPISDEFRRVVQEIQLGITTEKALDNLLRRIPSDDLDLVVTAMNVQREVGGNLAEILETISHTIRDRVKLKGEIRVMTSQQSYTGTFLSVLPVLVVLVLYVMNKSYISALWGPEGWYNGIPCGYCALGATFVLIVAGYFVMKKISQIDV